MLNYFILLIVFVQEIGSLKLPLWFPKVISLGLALTTSTPNLIPVEPTPADNALIQSAFRDYDAKNLARSEDEFDDAIKTWESLNRPRDELVTLLKARANVRLDRKEFNEALQDYDRSLDLMKVDGENDKGIGRYPEYADTFVGRGLAYEGLGKWEVALENYNKAVTLWGGQSTTDRDASLKPDIKAYNGVNPYALTFRGNVLNKLGNCDQALVDFDVASSLFIGLRDIPRFSDARANYALTLYNVGREVESVKVMKDVIRKNPGYADMHVALAADSWSKGNYVNALKEWQFTCDSIAVGCDSYKDLNWVKNIRRWPDSLTKKLGQFLTRELPDGVLGDPNAPRAPPPSVSS